MLDKNEKENIYFNKNCSTLFSIQLFCSSHLHWSVEGYCCFSVPKTTPQGQSLHDQTLLGIFNERTGESFAD